MRLPSFIGADVFVRRQLIAFKLNELHSVKYRQLPADRLPNRLTSTVAGTDYFLTEIRNVVSTPQDIVDLWGCDPKQIKILGIDLGQAFVVGASALLPSRNKHLDKEGSLEGAQEDPLVKQPTTKYFNLSVKQKAVYQPTFKLRRWMEQRRAQPLEGGGSISQIETSLPAYHGPDASISEYTARVHEVQAQLDSFYGNVVLKKHRWNAKKARDEEYRLIANRLLELVGGSLGAKRKESNKVVIGVGLGQFSSRIRLSSLHESFESYFIQRNALSRSPFLLGTIAWIYRCRRERVLHIEEVSNLWRVRWPSGSSPLVLFRTRVQKVHAPRRYGRPQYL
ncbi:MAG: hypothetical protein J3R72DRAFT_57815 [Linnemannia gamsii]|nr:MAG: hypothetical protein J3R72DRAFT_57815 [Linnemannia gamsii]